MALALLLMADVAAQLPVLSGTAQFVSQGRRYEGTLLADDGSLFLVDRPPYRLQIAKIAAGGLTPTCSLSIESRGTPTSISLAAGNQVWIAGLTDSPNFLSPPGPQGDPFVREHGFLD